ncbi:carbohydrate ABC transporter membrane protein 2 (CUT1 family) [Hydrogenispora ethanolica]|jgi:putative aldouronate transport system permease protein|uniref:Carbohydrate ABC transporter membrane protein 2 (CUT1 family) n=1 Tax=Hydrogenispora ethanolica TaxID=1082276 RepID=A0A4R1RQP9_HYDET|nr:carbohydrate ABC transporter permease [Hydrogenispora ethanolica]TCL68569.1 carbohydrate ABC transporter membrane protein 2 (CUT1 family) [Hydrogenispora ethanolica]
MSYRASAVERLVTGGIYALMFLICVVTLYPFLYILSTSLASSNVPLTQIQLIPPEISLESYRRVLEYPLIGIGYCNTIVRTVLGTFLSVLVTLMMAYPLSKKYFPHRTFWTGLVVFTMFFSGGIIPNYILVRSLGLMNTVWALVLPELVSAFNLVIVRNFMMSLPDSLEESAKIDGANDITILFRIVLPICKPIIATIALWVAVWHWNSWFDSLIYATRAENQVVQLVMRRIVLEGSQNSMSLSAQMNRQNEIVTPENLKAATIMVTTIPILLVYPFVQKYFVKGIMIGSLKG